MIIIIIVVVVDAKTFDADKVRLQLRLPTIIRSLISRPIA